MQAAIRLARIAKKLSNKHAYFNAGLAMLPALLYLFFVKLIRLVYIAFESSPAAKSHKLISRKIKKSYSARILMLAKCAASIH